jgi:hypothetical protein
MEILSVMLSAKAHEKGGQFSIQKAATALGLGPDAEISLTVRRASGELVFQGPAKMGSGFEVYGEPARGLGPCEPIIAEVSLPPRTQG